MPSCRPRPCRPSGRPAPPRHLSALRLPRGRLARRCRRGGARTRAPVHGERDAGPASGRCACCRRLPPRGSGRAFVDFQNDVTAKDIGLAVREGFESIEHVKRYTTTGMATDQGKTSNMNALGLVAEALGKPIAEVGTTTFRPPYTPVTFGALAGPSRGALFDPVRTHADPRLGRRARRGVRGRRPVEARPLLPAARRGHARRGRARMHGRAHARRHVRRLDARQDRGGGAGRGRVPEPHLHQRLREARARPLPLRPDAERGRLHLRRRRRRPARAATAST